MTKVFPSIFLLMAVTLVLISVFWGGSYSRFAFLKENLSFARKKNAEISSQVEELSNKVYSIKHDPRALEIAARNELGLARPNELIFIFEDEK